MSENTIITSPASSIRKSLILSTTTELTTSLPLLNGITIHEHHFSIDYTCRVRQFTVVT